jgi:hypothetical protein
MMCKHGYGSHVRAHAWNVFIRVSRLLQNRDGDLVKIDCADTSTPQK